METVCYDSVDNDADGDVDCADPNCNAASCGSGCTCIDLRAQEVYCYDGIDNDGDGAVDCADRSACDWVSCGSGCVCWEGGKHETTCYDGTDNDGDTLVDCADPDCLGLRCAGVYPAYRYCNAEGTCPP
jgi:hypothetical protein